MSSGLQLNPSPAALPPAVKVNLITPKQAWVVAGCGFRRVCSLGLLPMTRSGCTADGSAVFNKLPLTLRRCRRLTDIALASVLPCSYPDYASICAPPAIGDPIKEESADGSMGMPPPLPSGSIAMPAASQNGPSAKLTGPCIDPDGNVLFRGKKINILELQAEVVRPSVSGSCTCMADGHIGPGQKSANDHRNCAATIDDHSCILLYPRGNWCRIHYLERVPRR